MGMIGSAGARHHVRTKEEVVEEAERIGHELIERARAVHTCPHPALALEQLRAELHRAGHLELDVKRVLLDLPVRKAGA